MRKWLVPMIYGIVGTVCVLTVALAVDCHIISRESGEHPELCRGSDSRALATLMSLLSTVLALRIPTSEREGDGAREAMDPRSLWIAPGGSDRRSGDVDSLDRLVGGDVRRADRQAGGGQQSPH